MAPEVYQREYGLEADMWSAGMMLYQCMTCRFPFWPSIQACREQSLDEVARAVVLDDILLDFGPWLEMSEEVWQHPPLSLPLLRPSPPPPRPFNSQACLLTYACIGTHTVPCEYSHSTMICEHNGCDYLENHLW